MIYLPCINLKMDKGRSFEQKRKFVEVITESAVEILDVKPKWITVVIDEYDREYRR